MMATNWTLLNNADDWDHYRKALAAGVGVEVNAVGWGNGPQHYPCLAASYPLRDANTGVMKMIGCYSYVSDAIRLLEAANVSVGKPSKEDVEPEDPPLTRDEVKRLKDHYRSTSANILALVKLMVDTKIVRQEQYEERYVAALAEVDQQEAAAKAAIEEHLTQTKE